MNGLSWLLYFSDVSDSLGWSFGLVMIFCGIATAASLLVLAMSLDHDMFSRDEKGAEGRKALRGGAFRTLRWFGTTLVVVFVAATLVPSSRTLMLIAASQFGETALNSDTAKQIGGEAGDLANDTIRLLRKYVTDQLGETPAPKTETK